MELAYKHHAARRHHGHRRPAAARPRRLPLPLVNLVAEERTVKGSYIGTCVPARDIPRYIELYQRGKLPVDRLMSGKLKLEEINEGFDRCTRARRSARSSSSGHELVRIRQGLVGVLGAPEQGPAGRAGEGDAVDHGRHAGDAQRPAAVAAGRLCRSWRCHGGVGADGGRAGEGLVGGRQRLERARGHADQVRQGGKDEIATAVLERMVDPRQWMSGDRRTGRRAGSAWPRDPVSPTCGTRAQVRAGDAGLDPAAAAQLEHQRIVLDAWVRAAAVLSEELPSRPRDARPCPRPEARVGAVDGGANKRCSRRSAPNSSSSSQRELIRSSTDLRIAQQDLAEHFGKQFGFPTRTELDDVHRTLTDMRRELRR